MSYLDSVAIVGANLAGARVAESLRRRGYGGRVLLIGTEPHLPYERPPLSKQVLLDGLSTPDSLFIRSGEQWADLDVEVRTAETIASIDRSLSSLHTESGEVHSGVDVVVLCTGGRNRILNVPGGDLEAVYYLRDLEDAATLSTALKPGARVVLVGGGYIGCEIAASAVTRGCDVTVLEAMPYILSRALPSRWSDVIAQEHRRKGVQIRASTSVRRFVGDDWVRGVELADGELLEADIVVVGIGMEPAVDLGRSLELKVDGGILVDEAGRTSHPRVFASGDVTIQPDVWGGSGLRRLESFQNAQEQSDSVAAAILDQELPKRPAPWFWSDQYDMNIQSAGVVEDGDDVVVRGSIEDGNFCAFHLRHERLVGAFAVNRGRDVRAAMSMIELGGAVVPAELADTSNDLRRLRVS